MARYKRGPVKLKTHYFPALYPLRYPCASICEIDSMPSRVLHAAW